jgi:transposase-like protein
MVDRATRYERSPERMDTRPGSYVRKLETKAGVVRLKVPQLRSLPFETAIIEHAGLAAEPRNADRHLRLVVC